MADDLAFISMVIGFASVIVAGAKLGAGSLGSLAGLFPSHGGRDWPIGVQERDAPRFVFAPRPATPIAGSEHVSPPSPRFATVDLDGNTPVPQLLELYSGPIRD